MMLVAYCLRIVGVVVSVGCVLLLSSCESKRVSFDEFAEYAVVSHYGHVPGRDKHVVKFDSSTDTFEFLCQAIESANVSGPYPITDAEKKGVVVENGLPVSGERVYRFRVHFPNRGGREIGCVGVTFHRNFGYLDFSNYTPIGLFEEVWEGGTVVLSRHDLEPPDEFLAEIEPYLVQNESGKRYEWPREVEPEPVPDEADAAADVEAP